VFETHKMLIPKGSYENTFGVDIKTQGVLGV
jgi:hypothetical protein